MSGARSASASKPAPEWTGDTLAGASGGRGRGTIAEVPCGMEEDPSEEPASSGTLGVRSIFFYNSHPQLNTTVGLHFFEPRYRRLGTCMARSNTHRVRACTCASG